jgi:hypothetical protein
MLVSRRISLALAAVCLSLMMFASGAFAAGPASVIVRVEGTNETLVPPTEVTTTTSPVVKDGNSEDSCPGTSGLGALQLATGGNWSGPWEATYKQYEIYSIDGENHAFGGGSYWDLWINHMASEVGACNAELETGEEVLLFPCSEEAKECPTPLGIHAPVAVDVEEPVLVSVTKYSASGVESPAANVTIAAGPTDAITNANGQVTVKFPNAGDVTVRASEPEFVRTEATVCVYNGNDGTCGRPSPSGSVSAGGPLSPPYTGPYAVVAKAVGVIDGHVYSRKDAPSVLAGSVLAHTAVASVSLELRRSYKGRCYAYDGVSTRFIKARCGQGSFFKVSTTPSFSYLLPSALAPGRYVLDIQATDAAGNHSTLARGSSRIVFYVG